VQCGTHAELVAVPGPYRRRWESARTLVPRDA
jgi:hypothetical protein